MGELVYAAVVRRTHVVRDKRKEKERGREGENSQSNKRRDERRRKRERIQDIPGVPDALIMHYLEVRVIVRIPAED